MLSRRRIEVLLGAALLLPLLLPAGGGFRALLSGALDLLPPLGAAEVGADDPAVRWRNAYDREIHRNAELLDRLLALGEPARLVPLDPAYWARNPLRVEAEVVARDSSPWRGSVTLSVGARQGIRPGCPVVVGDHLVGLVAEVGPLVSWVRLLSDPGQRAWAEIIPPEEREGAEGCVVGRGGDDIEMTLVPAGRGAAGDPIFTTGESALVPRGLLLGHVGSITDTDRSGLAEITVVPAVDLSAVRIVNVLVPEAH